MWIWLGLVSMFFLGVYDVCKKHALRENAVLPVLFLSNLASVQLAWPLLLAWLASFVFYQLARLLTS